MSTADEIKTFEIDVRKAGLRMAEILREAGIDRSMWTRWRNGTTNPRLDNWRAVEAARDRLRAQLAAPKASAA